MRMSREITLFNQQDDMNYTTKLAIEFATMIANGWTSDYNMTPSDKRHALAYTFWNYDGANGFNNYTSGHTSCDCSAFMTVVWAVATATAYKAPIARDHSYTNGRKMMPLSRGTVDPNRPNTMYSPSTDNFVNGYGTFQGLTAYGFEIVPTGSKLQPGDVCVIKNWKVNGETYIGHTFMILEPMDGDWFWDGNQKYFKVVHCSGGSPSIRIQDNWGMKDNVGRTPIVYRYTYEH